MEYPRLGKEQKIIIIDRPYLMLEDESVWYCHPKTTPIPDEWIAEEMGVVNRTGAVRLDGVGKRNYKITNTKRKQDVSGFWVNPPSKFEKNVKDYDIAKGRKSTVDDTCPSEADLTESEEGYPDKWLGQNWSIASIQEDDRVRDWQSGEPKAYYMIVEDRKGSVWELQQFSVGNFDGWKIEQTVRISKCKPAIKIYYMENLNIPHSQAATVRFIGWIQSKF